MMTLLRKGIFPIICMLAVFQLPSQRAKAQWVSHLVYTGGYESLRCLEIYDANNIFAGGTTRIFTSTDGGVSWVQKDVVDSLGDPYYCIVFGIHFVTPEEGFLVGNFYYANAFAVLHTTNAGDTWEVVYYYSYNSDAVTSDISFGDASNGIITCSENRILRTTDGGETWTQSFPLAPAANYISVAHVNSNTAFIVGDSVILKTNDNGITFDVTIFPGYQMSEVQFLDDQNGYISTTNRQLLKTTDGGTSWQDLTLPVSLQVTNLYFTDVDTGYLTEFEHLYRTVDGGYSWEVGNDFSSLIGDLEFISSNSAIAVGYKYAFLSDNPGNPQQFTPSANFDLPWNYNYCSGEEIALTSENGDAFSYEWLINSQHYSYAKDTTVVFTTGNTSYSIDLNVSNGSNTGTDHQSIYIYNSPIDFTLDCDAAMDTFCGYTPSYLSIYNTVPGVTYQVKNGNSIIYGPQTGNGGTLTFNFTLGTTATFKVEGFSNTSCDSNYQSKSFAFYQVPFLSNPAITALDDSPCSATGTFIHLSSSTIGNGYYVNVAGFTPYDTVYGTGSAVDIPTGPLVSPNPTVYSPIEWIPFGNCTKDHGDVTLSAGDPVAAFTPVPYHTFPNEPVTLVPADTGAATYSWEMENGNPSSSILMSPTVSFPSIDTNVITFIIGDQTGCYDTSEYNIIVCSQADTSTSATCNLFRDQMAWGETFEVGAKLLDFKVDREGNTYAIGFQDSSINYGVGYLFVRKYDVNGNLLWENLQNGSDLGFPYFMGAYATQMTVDDYGNVYFVGTHKGGFYLDDHFVWGSDFDLLGFAAKLNGETGVCEWIIIPYTVSNTPYWSPFLDIEYVDEDHIYILLGPGTTEEKMVYPDASEYYLTSNAHHILVVNSSGHFKKEISYEPTNYIDFYGLEYAQQFFGGLNYSPDVFFQGPQLHRNSSSTQLTFEGRLNVYSNTTFNFGSISLSNLYGGVHVLQAIMDTSGTWLSGKDIFYYGYRDDSFSYVPICKTFNNIPIYADDGGDNITAVGSTGFNQYGDSGFVWLDPSTKITSDSMTYLCNYSSDGVLKWNIQMPFTRIQQMRWIDHQLIISGNFTSFFLYPNTTNPAVGFTSEGLSDQDIFFIALDTLGNLLWQENYGSAGEDYFYLMDYDSCSGYLYFIAAGNDPVHVKNETLPLNSEYYTARISLAANCSQPLCQLATNSSHPEVNQFAFTINPNPASDVATVYDSHLEQRTITISDISGKVVSSFVLKEGMTSVTIDLSKISEGVYLAVLTGATGILGTEKIIVSR